MRQPALLLLLLFAGCGPERESGNAEAAETRAPAAALPSASPEQIEEGRRAAEALRLYYAAIGSGDYRAAWALRERRPGLAFEDFAAGFSAYEDYRATVGVPSLPVEADGWVWIDFPVQLYGRQRGGAPFGSVGRVTMKRPAEEPAGWRIVA